MTAKHQSVWTKYLCASGRPYLVLSENATEGGGMGGGGGVLPPYPPVDKIQY